MPPWPQCGQPLDPPELDELEDEDELDELDELDEDELLPELETLPLEVETLPLEVETPDDVETLPLEVETPPVEVEVDTPPVEVDTPPVDVETPPVEVEMLPLDVENDEQMKEVFDTIGEKWGHLDFVLHSIAFAPKDDLHGRVTDSSREGFLRAMDISCHSFARMAHLAEPLMKSGGCLLTMSYHGADEVVSNYGIMGPVKAALQSALNKASSRGLGSAAADGLTAEGAARKRAVRIDQGAPVRTHRSQPKSTGTGWLALRPVAQRQGFAPLRKTSPIGGDLSGGSLWTQSGQLTRLPQEGVRRTVAIPRNQILLFADE